MNAITACAAACVWCSAYTAEHAVSSVKNTSMPAHDEMNNGLRPTRSTRNDARTAQNKFQIARTL